MPPQLVFCHYPFHKALPEIQAYRETHGYDGVEWSLDGWRLMMARDRRRPMRSGPPTTRVSLKPASFANCVRE